MGSIPAEDLDPSCHSAPKKKKKKNYKCGGIYESQDAVMHIARGLNMSQAEEGS